MLIPLGFRTNFHLLYVCLPWKHENTFCHQFIIQVGVYLHHVFVWAGGMMALSSIFVVSNSLLLQLHGPQKKKGKIEARKWKEENKINV